MNCEVVARAALCQPATLFYCAMHRTHSRLSPFSQTYRRARRGVRVLFLSRSRVLLTFALLYSHLFPLRSLPLPLPHARAPRTARAFFFPFLFRTSFLSFPLRGGGSSFLAILLLSTFLFPPSPSLFQRAGIVERSLLFKGINDAVRLYRISLPLLPILLVLQ